ncbi:RNA-binding protein [Diaphorobacter sp. HDW4B]|uniref:RNA recognition motif domain-containing protein n=1 Tax=Diaphorobacter sp. HDW4B TaxID=2714925 RepID=UPI00140AD062|nr:RNA-binding protein [Diaphorobacter sp. HDW4B]QIL71812.1 RNA-binding protein [Diaphorobacter sp. HDW4B]
MNNRLYVGNLAYSATNETLIQQFSEFGTVSSAKLVMDRETGRSKGFAFVEMETEADAQAAINALDGKSVDGRAIKVNVARPPEPRTGGFGGGGDRGGYRNNRY